MYSIVERRSECCSAAAAFKDPIALREFIVTKRLGSGAQAVVYAAHDSLDADQTSVAIKVFNDFDEDEFQTSESFAAEVKVHEEIGSHENILPLIAHYNEQNVTIKVPSSIPNSPDDIFAEYR